MPARMASSVASTPGSTNRQKCFLCEMPKGPWAMLYDFCEPVCRACCNYEGIDRIAETIEKARHQRRSFDGPTQPEGPTARLSPHHHDVVGMQLSTNVSRQSIHPGVRQAPIPISAAYAVIPAKDGKMQVVPAPVTAISKHGFTIPGIPQAIHTSFARMQPAVPSNGTSIPATFTMHPTKSIPITDVVPNHGHDTAQRFAQIQDTLNMLSKSPPFRVRFSKDHSLHGRVIAFDAVCRGSDYELKVFIEYPIGSGTVFQSASGAGRQMYGEFRERLGIGGGFRGASSNGYKDLEFERIYEEDNWRVLGELLTEEVRFFRGPVKKDLLPTPFLDPKFPNLPPATLNATRGFLRNNLLNRKRRSSNEDGEARKEIRLENGYGAAKGGADELHSPGSRSPTSARSPTSPTHQTNSPRANGHAASPTSPHSPHSPPKTPASKHSPTQTSPPGTQQDIVMQCLLCHRTLEDTRFVQCPSQSMHKFCFTCSKDSIKSQSEASSDVYCPSGMRCLVQGSSTPWAFMEQEITTILGASV